MHSNLSRDIFFWLAFAVLAFIPLVGGNFLRHMGILVAINIITVQGLYIIYRSGQLSFGHAAFMAVGAYVAAIAVKHYGWPFAVAALLGVVGCCVVALIVGWIILRARGVYFVLITFALGELVRLVMLNMNDLSGGANGLSGLGGFTIFGLGLHSKLSIYLVIGALAVAITFLTRSLFRHRLGEAIECVGIEPALSESVGLSVRNIQLFCFVLGAFLAAVGGILEVFYIDAVSPESFNVTVSIALIIILIVGGRTSYWGPVIGSMVMTPLPELLRGAVYTQQALYGLAVLAILFLVPGGLAAKCLGLWRGGAK